MEQFPSNAQSRRPERHAREVKNTDETPKVEKVLVKGKVTRRKQTLGARFKKSFLGGEAQDVGNHIVFELLIPALKELALQMVNEGLQKALWQGRERPSSSRIGIGRPRQDYGGYSRSRLDDRDRRDVGRRTREHHTFDDIILDSRDEANDILDAMDDKIEKYRSVSVADMYSYLGVTPDFTDERYGWTKDTFRTAKVVSTRAGFLLDLPPTELIDDDRRR